MESEASEKSVEGRGARITIPFGVRGGFLWVRGHTRDRWQRTTKNSRMISLRTHFDDSSIELISSSESSERSGSSVSTSSLGAISEASKSGFNNSVALSVVLIKSRNNFDVLAALSAKKRLFHRSDPDPCDRAFAYHETARYQAYGTNLMPDHP